MEETKRGEKAVANAGLKTVAKTASKTSRRRYHLLWRSSFTGTMMTGEDRRNFLNIVSRRWKEIKEDSARLSTYNDVMIGPDR